MLEYLLLKILGLQLQSFGRFCRGFPDRVPPYTLQSVTVFQYALNNSDMSCHPPDIREEGGGVSSAGSRTTGNGTHDISCMLRYERKI